MPLKMLSKKARSSLGVSCTNSISASLCLGELEMDANIRNPLLGFRDP